MADTVGAMAACSGEARELQERRQPRRRTRVSSGTAIPGTTYSKEACKSTLWEEFIQQREDDNRPFAEQLLMKMFVEWSVVAVVTQVIIAYDTEAYPLFYWTLSIKAMMLAFFGFNIATVRYGVCGRAYSSWVTLGVTAFAILHFAEGVGSDILNRQYNVFSKETFLSEGSTFSSEILGAHQTQFLLIILSNGRLLLQNPEQHIFLFVALALACHAMGFASLMYDGQLSYVYVSVWEYLRAAIPFTIVSATNMYGSHLRLHDDWTSFVQRKRLQLACISSEELLTLAMPRDIAHELMVGNVRTRTHSMVSLAFFLHP
eukprot:gb/GECG01013264.1/.p1 GENE.gb/GECG01013264.1/~~gb/GECG01013264.1/.p1  ORF type:complete len:317 (+),score=21.81 gb/GECG01013264.1/:1-951(+)